MLCTLLKINMGKISELSNLSLRLNFVIWGILTISIFTYSNYVVQHLLTLNIQEVAELLLQRFQGYFLHLSCNKFASNVVEKVLESSEKCCKTIVMELLRSPTASMLLLDPFGNFVIQRALSASKVRYSNLVQLWNSNITNLICVLMLPSALGSSRSLHSVLSGLGIVLCASP